MKISKFARAAVAALALVAFTAAGPIKTSAWPVEELNKTVNQTNFILDNICSATLISLKYKLVVTNFHCIDQKVTIVDKEEKQPDGTIKTVKREKLEDVSLYQKGYQGFEQVGSSEYIAQIVAHKKTRDLGLVQIKADTIPHSIASKLLPENKKMARGDKVYAVGNPAMLDATVSDGIISSMSRTFDVPWADNEKLNWIQFTAPIAGGNSGGALYNDDGEFLGIPAAGHRGGGDLGFAIPVHYVRELLKEACFESVYNAAADDAGLSIDLKCRADKDAARKKADEKK